MPSEWGWIGGRIGPESFDPTLENNTMRDHFIEHPSSRAVRRGVVKRGFDCRVVMGTGHNKFFRRGNTYHRVCDGGGGGGGVVINDTTYLIDITDKISLALKFEWSQKYSASGSQHC